MRFFSIPYIFDIYSLYTEHDHAQSQGVQKGLPGDTVRGLWAEIRFVFEIPGLHLGDFGQPGH